MADKAKARTAALRLIQEHGVRAAPVPLDRIVRAAGVVVQYSPFDGELSGMAFIKDGQPIIGVNSLHSSTRQRFTLAHELGHILLHRPVLEASGVHVDKGSLRRDSLSSEGVDDQEIEANNFAAELLMPEPLLAAALVGHDLDLEDEEAVQALAKKFKVSATALQFRVQRS
ncbi:ImmA/IrrE family metallo-endopeptidase [Roseiarcaceae bacterium H3SJ34-1]|uniref:ImmA/IrrE family metallo-endopeptidase n=1 Tax=Terripilifer ovatus TaxID=3032367 RepID=UPI003AB992B8|nr:ImmA/IrrE family metallo-endopeptidase [Roseiarcaceae bacterium H3SJ34-1]